MKEAITKAKKQKIGNVASIPKLDALALVVVEITKAMEVQQNQIKHIIETMETQTEINRLQEDKNESLNEVIETMSKAITTLGEGFSLNQKQLNILNNFIKNMANL